MQVTLGVGDLKPEFQKNTVRDVEPAVGIEEVTFSHFNKKARRAVIDAGGATYKDGDLRQRWIHPPAAPSVRERT